MLQRVHIQNYKCLRDVEVELSPLTVLIGPNDSGKTSFLTCLHMLGVLANPINDPSPNPNRSQQKERIARFLAERMRANSWRFTEEPVLIEGISTHPLDFSYTFRTGRGSNRHMQQIKIGANESIKSAFPESNVKPQTPSTFRGNRFDADANQSLLQQIIAVSGGAVDDLKQIQQELKISEPYHFSPSEMRKASDAKPSPVLGARGENLASVLNAMLTGADRAAVNELEQSLNQAIPTLRGLSTPPTDKNGALRLIKFAMSGPERPPLTIPSDEASDGAMFLTAFLALIHTQSTQVLLIEEPENGLHPSRLQTVIELLRKATTGELGYSQRQVILSTHSPLLLNFVDPSEVRIFRRGDDEATNVVRMDDLPDIQRLTKEFALGELWYLFGEEALSRGAAE